MIFTMISLTMGLAHGHGIHTGNAQTSYVLENVAGTAEYQRLFKPGTIEQQYPNGEYGMSLYCHCHSGKYEAETVEECHQHCVAEGGCGYFQLYADGGNCWTFPAAIDLGDPAYKWDIHHELDIRIYKLPETADPTAYPTRTPSVGPTPMPSSVPTGGPTPMPSAYPTGGPTPMPSAGPTGGPTPMPSADPTTAVIHQAVFDLDAAEGRDARGKIVDSAGGLEFAGGALVNDGTDRAHFDLASGPLERTAGSRTETSTYSHAYVLKWRASDSGWRTLLRHSHDHCAIVQSGTKNLGFYSNRNGAFRDSGYDITPNQDRWELLVVTGESTNGAIGTSTFWVEGQDGVMTSVGTSDRVCSGMDYYRVGWSGQNPGKVARILAWDRVLSTAEISDLHASLMSGISGADN